MGCRFFLVRRAPATRARRERLAVGLSFYGLWLFAFLAAAPVPRARPERPAVGLSFYGLWLVAF